MGLGKGTIWGNIAEGHIVMFRGGESNEGLSS